VKKNNRGVEEEPLGPLELRKQETKSPWSLIEMDNKPRENDTKSVVVGIDRDHVKSLPRTNKDWPTMPGK
jgi:hypothetical protein